MRSEKRNLTEPSKREARLKQALKANMQRRKAQARARDEDRRDELQSDSHGDGNEGQTQNG